MKKRLRILFRPFSLLAGLIAASLLVIGCSLFEAPTASSESVGSADNMWSPQLGDELVPGRQIPIILDTEYWETPGMVNPNLRGPTNIISVLISGAVGGTVRHGNHNYAVPAGAVSGMITFTIALASGTGIGVDCGPSPLNFNAGVTARLTLSYAGTQYDPDYCERAGIEPLDASLLQIWYVPANGDAPVPQEMGRVFDAGSKTISVRVDHFSRYIVA